MLKNYNLRKVILIPVFLLIYSQCVFGQAKCDIEKSQIKEFAKRHIENKSPMQTNTVITIMDASDCFTKKQIAIIYEKEYNKLRQQEEGFWEKIRPNMGWIIAILLVFILAFQEFLKKRFEKIFDLIALQIYKKVTGIKFINRFAIKKYQKALVEKYSKIKIPFRQNRPLQMKEIYISLKALNSNSSSEIDVLDAITEYKKVMIIGPPGSGKSMLCKNIMFNFGSGLLSIKNIPILIELHRLNNNQVNIQSLLIDELNRNSFPNSENFVNYNLKEGNLLLLFDGFDEVSSPERKRVAQMLNDFIDEYDCPNFIITCRTAVYQNEFEGIVNQTLELAEFNSHQMRQFLQAWEDDMPSVKSIEQLMTILQDSPQIMSLATNPLMLTIIAYLYADTDHVLPHSRGEFYLTATDVLLNQWHNERNSFDAAGKSLILQQLALSNQDEAKSKVGDRKVIKNTKVIEEIGFVLPRLGLPLEDTKNILNEIVERSGLLLAVDGGEFYQFAHLTMQEFFAAKQLRDDEQGLLDRFKKDPYSWRESVKLWCGLTNDATKLISNIFTIDKTVAFECIAEAKSVDPLIANSIIDFFIQNISLKEYESDSIYKAFGLVASDKRNRGKELFEYLENKLLESEDNIEASFIIKCLSYTFLPKAAIVISNYYSQYEEVFEALLKMGDIAVPSIKNIIENGELKALDCLAEIKTPEAALALLSFIWKDDDKAIIASIYLSQIVSIKIIEDALRKHPLPSMINEVKFYDWVWKPFKEKNNYSLKEKKSYSLSFIYGRIVYLIHQNNKVDFSKFTHIKMDFRIAIPLVILNPDIKFDSINESSRNILLLNSYEDEVILKDLQTNVKLYSTNEFEELQNIVLDEVTAKNEENRIFTFIIKVLPRQIGLKLLFCIFKKKPSIIDWENIFKPIRYRFLKSPEFVLLYLITILLATPTFFIDEIGLQIDFNKIFKFTGFIGIALNTSLVLLKNFYKKNELRTILEKSTLNNFEINWFNFSFNRNNFLSFILYSALSSLFVFFGYYDTMYLVKKIEIKYVFIIWVIIIGITLMVISRKTKMERRASNPLIGLLPLSPRE